MKKIALLALWICTLTALGQNPEELFEEANALYLEEQYRPALNKYQEIVDQGLENTALYYNMGNAYFKSNQLAESILYYQRALKLSPYDDDVRQNLKIARKTTIDRFEEVPKPLVRTAYLALMQALTPGNWGISTLILFLILLVGLGLYLFTSFRRPGFSLAAIALVLGILSFSLAHAHKNHLQNNRPAVIMATSSYVKSGPSEKAEDVFILHEGTSTIVTEDYEGWKKIKLPDGKVGWIESSDLLEV